MSKEFVELELDKAHDEINKGDYGGAIERLKNIKLRVHNKEAGETITSFEKKRDNEFNSIVAQIDESGDDELRKDENRGIEIVKYAKSYMNFYDKLLDDYPIR